MRKELASASVAPRETTTAIVATPTTAPTSPRVQRSLTREEARAKKRRIVRTTHPPTRKVSADVALIRRGLEAWIMDGKMKRLSEATLADRRFRVGKVIWYLEHEATGEADSGAMQGFMEYLTRPDKWGNSEKVNKSKVGCSPTGASVYYRTLRTFFRFMVEEGLIDASPLEAISAPRVPRDQIMPLSVVQVEAMVSACEKTQYPKRNRALLSVLFDTGLRVGEIVALKVGDIDLAARRIRVRDGKMGKDRLVPFGLTCARRLREYLSLEVRGDGEAVWIGECGTRAGEGMTESGVQQVVRKLGRFAGIKGVRVSPHTLRHTFAIEFLRRGGEVYSLQYILGHSDLEMTRRYVHLAQADVDVAMSKFSPLDGVTKSR